MPPARTQWSFVALILGSSWLVIVHQNDIIAAQSTIDPCNKTTPCEDPSPRVPNPENCTQYFECIDEEWLARPCPTDTLFDKDTLLCEADEANCQEPCSVPISTTTATPAVCPPDFTYIEPINGCYKVVLDNLDWTVAGVRCRSLHKDAHLVVISSEEEQDYIVAMLSFYDGTDLQHCRDSGYGHPFWTAGQRIDPTRDSTFMWKPFGDCGCMNLFEMNYTKWTAGQPDYYGATEHCTCLLRDQYYEWGDEDCILGTCFVCELDLA